MIEKVVIRDSFKSDLFTQLVGEEMIFQRIIDSTNLKQDVEGGLANCFQYWKSWSKVILSRATRGKSPMMRRQGRCCPLLTAIGAPQKSGTKNNDKRFNKCAFIRNFREGIQPRIVEVQPIIFKLFF